MSWEYFNKFDAVTDKYLPATGEGETMATQAVTAVCKLVYKWFNDGDVYDNTYYMTGWCNDLSTYANWLYKYVGDVTWRVMAALERIVFVDNDNDYEKILKDLADAVFDEEIGVLQLLEEHPKTDSIYSCKGIFKFEEPALFGEEW